MRMLCRLPLPDIRRIAAVGTVLPPADRKCRGRMTAHWYRADDQISSRRRLRRPPQEHACLDARCADQLMTYHVIGSEGYAGACDNAVTGIETVIKPFRVTGSAEVHPVCKIAVAAAVAHFSQPSRGEADTLAGVRSEYQPVNLEGSMLEFLVLNNDVTAGIAIRYRCAIGDRASANAQHFSVPGAYMKCCCSVRGSIDGDNRGSAQRESCGNTHKASSHASFLSNC